MRVDLFYYAFELVLDDVPARRQSRPAPFLALALVLRSMGIETETVELIESALFEGVKFGPLEERGHGEGHLAIDDGADIMAKFV